MQSYDDVVLRILEAGTRAAQIVRVDDTHLVLILEFASAEDANRVAQDVGGPWMRGNILPLLAWVRSGASARSSSRRGRR